MFKTHEEFLNGRDCPCKEYANTFSKSTCNEHTWDESRRWPEDKIKRALDFIKKDCFNNCPLCKTKECYNVCDLYLAIKILEEN